MGDKKYFNHRSVTGETQLSAAGAINRIYMVPKSGDSFSAVIRFKYYVFLYTLL